LQIGRNSEFQFFLRTKFCSSFFNLLTEEIQRLEVNDCFPLMCTADIYITSTVGSTCRLQYLCLFGKDILFALHSDWTNL
jgi:hypothetical protein